jgi:hypothetical protein
MERTDARGNPSEKPTDYLELEVPDGVVLDKTFLERDEPLAEHNEEQLEEDDSFLSVGSETWEYEVADGRDQDFMDALKNTRMAIECIPIEDDN